MPHLPPHYTEAHSCMAIMTHLLALPTICELGYLLYILRSLGCSVYGFQASQT